MSETSEVKRANWLELLFDLVFVYAIAKATHTIADPHDGHISAQSYGLFILIIIPIWWAWTGHTLFSTRFCTEDTTHRVMTLAQMLAALFLTAFISPDFGPNYLGFLASYLVVRLLLVVMYLRIAQLNPSAASVAYNLSIGFGIGLAVGLCSLFFDSPWRYIVLYAGIGIEIASPVLLRRRLEAFPVDRHHMPERFGLLTIILLGESVIALGSPMSNSAWTTLTFPVVVLGFVVLVAAWWLYFTLTEERIVGKELGHGQRIVYGHLPLYAGLAIVANFVRFAINPVLNTSDHIIMAVAGAGLFLGALWFIHGPQILNSQQANIAIFLFLLGNCVLIVLAAAGQLPAGANFGGH
jgi:low temperature requirement protein LtrA